MKTKLELEQEKLYNLTHGKKPAPAKANTMQPKKDKMQQELEKLQNLTAPVQVRQPERKPRTLPKASNNPLDNPLIRSARATGDVGGYRRDGDSIKNLGNWAGGTTLKGVGGVVNLGENIGAASAEILSDAKNVEELAPYRNEYHRIKNLMEQINREAGTYRPNPNTTYEEYYANIEKKHGTTREELAKQLAVAKKALDERSAHINTKDMIGGKMYAKGSEMYEKSLEGATEGERMLTDVMSSVVQNAPAYGLGWFNRGAGMLGVGASAAGNKSGDLTMRGVGSQEAAARALGSGLVEAGTSYIPLGNLQKLKSPSLNNYGVNLLKQGAEEAVQEGVAYTGDYVMDSIAGDPTAQFSAKELGMSMAGGAVAGTVLPVAMKAITGKSANPYINVHQNGVNSSNANLPKTKEPSLPNMSKAEESVTPALPPSKLYVNPEWQASNVLPFEGTKPNLETYTEVTGKTILENTDELDFNTLNEQEEAYLNYFIQESKTSGRTIEQVANEMIQPYEAEVQKVIDGLAIELGNYSAKGISINQETSVRYSNNEKWYRDFFKENNRKPNKSELNGVATSLVMDDIVSQKGEYIPVELANSYQAAQVARSAIDKVPKDTVSAQNVGDKTITEQGRYRKQIVPKYTPNNRRQLLVTPENMSQLHANEDDTNESNVNLSTSEANAPEIEKAKQISNLFGSEIEFVETLGENVNGKYKDGKITIALDSTNPVTNVLTHELTHHIESAGQYQELSKMVQEYMGDNFDSLTKEIRELYEREGVRIDEVGAQKEVVATFMENRGLFENEAFVERISKENPNLFQKIYNWINDAIRRIGADKDTKFLIDAQRLYEKAMQQSVTSQNGNQFSIRKDTQGNSFVEINEDILEGVPRKDWEKTVKAIIKNKFGGGIDMGSFMVGVNKRSVNEFTHSGYTKGIKPRKQALYSDKLRSANNIDEITQTAEKVINETPKHPRRDKIRSFNRGTVNMRVGGRDYVADVVTAIHSDNSEYFYDVVNIKPTKIEATQYVAPSNNTQVTQIGAASTDNVSQEQNTVNTQYTQGDENNAQNSRSDVSELMERYTREHGAIKQGENPHREVVVPKATDKGKTRRFARTAMESEVIPDEMIGDFEKEIVNGTFAYEPLSDQQAFAYAERTIENKGYEVALADWDSVVRGNKAATKNDIVLGELLLNQAANAGDVKLAMKITAELAAEGTRAGQSIQAFRMLKKMTPDGQLYSMQKVVENLNSDLQEKRGVDSPNVKINEELAGKLLKAKTQQEVNAAVEEIRQDIADQVPPTLVDKWNAWRYLSMLGNPRTHIRNLIGNAIFMPAVNIKNELGAQMEKTLPEAQRTKARLTKKDARLKEFARNDFANVEETITSGGKLNPSDEIRERQQVFKTKWLEKARKANFNALEWEDKLFLTRHYTNAMARFIKARNLTPEFLQSGTKEANKALEEARNHAILEAQKATYRDASALATGLSKWKRSGKIEAVVGEGLFPFTKTPVNILKRGVEYSPIGLLNGAKGALIDVKKGKKSASQAIDQMASGLTGTGILALGAFLASQGMLSGGGSDDKKETLFDRLQGGQEYALKIGNTSFTLDWAAPSSLPLFVGVEIYNSLESGGEDVNFAAMLDGLTKISEPLVEMSMLQGLNNAFRAVSYSDSPTTDAGTEIAINYLSQGVPTVAGQLARTIDSKRRSSFIDKNSGMGRLPQKGLQKVQGKLPFANMLLNPYVDAWGREQESGNIAQRALQNFVSPSYSAKDKTTKVDIELERLYKQTGEGSVLPSYAAKYIRFDGETKNFTADEYHTYATEKGQMSFKYLEKLVSSKEYRSLSDDKKVDVVSSVYEYANAMAKTKVSDYQLTKSMQKAREAEKEGINPADYFSIYHVQKDIVGDSDGDGGTISGTATVNKRDAIDKATQNMSFDEREKLYDAFDVGLSKSQKAVWDNKSVQYIAGSKENFYKIIEIGKTTEPKVDQYGNAISGTAKKKTINAISKELNMLPPRAEQLYYEVFVYNYSVEDLGSSERQDYEALHNMGMNEDIYLKYSNGLKTVPNRKADRYYKLIQMGMGAGQAQHFLSLRYNYKW